MINKPNSGTVSVSRELLPCPYCGRSARYVAEDYVDNSGEPWPFAECDACNTGAPVELWNKRAQAADQQGEPVAIVDEADDGMFIEFIYGEDGSPLRRGDKLYRHAQPATAKVDERAEFDAAYDRGEFMPNDGPYDNPRKNQAFAVWQARAKLNGGQS